MTETTNPPEAPKTPAEYAFRAVKAALPDALLKAANGLIDKVGDETGQEILRQFARIAYLKQKGLVTATQYKALIKTAEQRLTAELRTLAVQKRTAVTDFFRTALPVLIDLVK